MRSVKGFALVALAAAMLSGGCGGGGGSPAVQPVSWWRAEGNALDSVGGNNGTLSGGVTYGPGHAGQAFVFDGTNGVVALSDPASLKITRSLTVDVWVKADAYPCWQQWWAFVLFRGDNRPGRDPYYMGVQDNGEIYFGVQPDQADLQEEVHAPLPLGRWTRVTGILDDAASKIRLYLNGRLAMEADAPYRPFADLESWSAPGISIGNSNDPSSFNCPFQGSIDELRIYNTVVPP